MGEREREQDLDRREKDLERREAELEARVAAAESILAAANERDADADERDTVANSRDRDADLKAFLGGEAGYGYDGRGRRHAALDRGRAKEDRVFSADDRAKLTEDDGVDLHVLGTDGEQAGGSPAPDEQDSAS